jgi:gliding motility-associated-like protein
LSADGANSYSWSPQTGLNSTSGEVVIANPSETTAYTIEGTDENGCTNTTSVNVQVSDLPLANAGPDQTLCSGSSTVLFGAGPFDAEFSWSPTIGLDDPTTAMPEASPGATTTYTLTVTDVNGCVNTDEVTITVITVVADFFADPITGNAPIDITFENNSSNAIFFEWDYGDGNTETTTLGITENSYEDNGSFVVTLVAIGPNGCSDTTSFTIVLQEPFFLMIPNIFTPNGDGINEFFELDVRGVSSIEVNVYNRWGNLVHTHNGVNGRWNGTHNGVRCADGVYFYTVSLTTLEGEQQQHNGSVTLLR